MSAPFVKCDEGPMLFVHDWGEGPPVVLMAGWAMDSRIWGETMLHLNAFGLRTIAYDRRGHGRSCDSGGYSYDALAEDLKYVLDSFDLTNATLVCHSGAGGEAIRYCTRYGTERISRLVLVGATGPRIMAASSDVGITPEMLDALCGQLACDLAGWIEDNIEPFAPGIDRRLQDWMAMMVLNCSRRAVVAFQRTIVEADLVEEVAALDIPVTIIHGTHDASAPLEASGERYAELIAKSELIVYKGAPHGLMVTHASRLAADIATAATQ